MKICVGIIIGLLGVLSVYAGGNSKVSVTINGSKNGITLTKEISDDALNVSNPKWLKEKKHMALSVTSKKQLTQEWQSYSFSFTPSESGKVVIILKGTYQMRDEEVLPDDIWSAYDLVMVKGAKINNGDFEDINDKGNPGWWWKSGKSQMNRDTNLGIEDEVAAVSGKRYVIGSANEFLSTNIEVTAGQVVTVTLQARSYQK